MKFINKYNRGVIGILTTLVLSFALVLIAVNMVLIGISSRENAFNLNQSEQVFIPVEGCAEDALIRLNRNNNYNGGSYTIDDVSCDVIVSGTDPNRDVTVTGSKNNITRDLFLRVQLTPTFAIIDWSD